MTNYDTIEQLTKLKGVCEQMGWSNNVKALEVDSFDIDDCVYLSGTDNDIDGVIAWMEIPSYKEG